MLRAIVFDFDGVLANTEPLHLRGYQDVLAGERITLDEREYYARYLGFDDVGAFRAIAKDRRLPWTDADIDRLVAQKALRLEELEREISVLFPGAADALRRAAACVPVAIASGARGEEIRRVLARESLAGLVAAVVAAEDTPVSKPAPDPYIAAVARLAEQTADPLRVGDCVAIEDSLWGLESAHTAGLRTVAVAHTYPAAELSAADLVVARIADLDLHAVARLCL